MKIEAGKFYQTRGGYKVRVYAIDGDGEFPIHAAIMIGGGWLIRSWAPDGGGCIGGINREDLVSEWVDKPVVDWSKLAAWHRWVAMNENGWWFAFTLKPILGKVSWVEDQCLGCSHPQFIHPNYSPTFSGDWKDSLVERPTE